MPTVKVFRFLTFLLLLSFCSLQTGKAEDVVVQLDKPLYTAGDLLGYQMFFPASFQGADLALKVAIYHPAGDLLVEHFIQTAGATSQEGYLKIPYNTPSNTYHWLLLGTSKDGQQRIKLGELFIPIFDDLADPSTQHQAPVLSSHALPSSELNIDFQWKTQKIERASTVSGTIQVQDQQGRPINGTLSVAVKDASLLALGTDNELSTHYLTIPDGMASQLSSKICILGRAVDAAGKGIQTSYLSAFVQATNQFYYTSTDLEGYFSIQLPGIPGNHTVQFMDYEQEDMQVTLSDNLNLGTSPQQNAKSSLSSYLKWSRLRKKIYQFYGTVENPIHPIPQEIPELTFEPDQRFPLQDYESFDDLTIFFNEIVTPFKIRPRGKRGYVARMFNPGQQIRQFYQGSPVFIVDGHLTRDANFIYQIPIEKIDTIDLFFFLKSLQPQFGPIAASGMVVIQTSLPELDLPETNRKNIFQLSLLQEEYESRAMTPQEQIDIGPSLLWLTNQTLQTSGKYQLDFPQSDDLGTFLIEIAVQSADGKMGTYTQYYEVSR